MEGATLDDLYDVEDTDKIIDNESTTDYVPVVLVLASSVQNKLQEQPMAALLDSGSTGTWIKRSALPKGAVPYKVAATRSATIAGIFESSLMVNISNVMLPEFSRSRRIDSFQARIIETPCKYDIILGRQELTKFAIDLSFSDQTIKFADVYRPMVNTQSLNTVTPDALATELLLDLMLEDTEDNDNDDAFTASEIKPSDYHEVQVKAVAESCEHLSPEKQEDLFRILSKY
jgi:hypothetical protein